jgi:hypothetical protein
MDLLETRRKYPFTIIGGQSVDVRRREVEAGAWDNPGEAASSHEREPRR